ncbi:cation:proton antiporter regulatory subunit [Actinomycetospora sp. TBRC 11914]|uniref:cation:proton antiporter regulatory subunit n=1 Tax=Actinomycetospora sp. TBRC 11914 TaxID=2729387 RepID=UPI00145F78C5|nr:cation:proton antiporter regulatory subunit [Actinomycetospora sp. TBRC 11914]NMO92607.1 cation:proton antiporter regulatory subunit [Actinomycetospora sp. TBRC 11914]
MDVEITRLPGIGTKQEFTTADGRRLGVLTHRDGHRELMLSSADDPDATGISVALSEPECNALGTLLGAPNLVAKLQDQQREVAGISTAQFPISVGSPYVGRPLADTAMRTRTATSIVAVVRDSVVSPSPRPDFVFTAGDLVVIVGTGEGLTAAAQILEEG